MSEGSRSRPPSALVWMPAGGYDAVKPIWQDQYVWCPVPVDDSLSPEQTSFIRLDEGDDAAGPAAEEEAGCVAAPADGEPLLKWTRPEADTTTQAPPGMAPLRDRNGEGKSGKRRRVPASHIPQTTALAAKGGHPAAGQIPVVREVPVRQHLGPPGQTNSTLPKRPSRRSAKANRRDDEQLVPMPASPYQRGDQSRLASGNKRGLTVHLNLNLDIEVQLKTTLRGDLTLTVF